jgi:hypothetical protein
LVRNAYTLYIQLRWCHDVRDGYAVKYVNDVEMQRAETALKAIVKEQKVKEPGMNTDALWQQANDSVGGSLIGLDVCHFRLRKLMDMSPVPAIRVEKPVD